MAPASFQVIRSSFAADTGKLVVNRMWIENIGDRLNAAGFSRSYFA